MWRRVLMGALATAIAVLTPTLGLEVAQARMGQARRPKGATLAAPATTPAEHAAGMADVLGMPGDTLLAQRPTVRSHPLARLQSDLDAYLQDKPGEYGVYIYDLKTSDAVGVHQNDVFPAASTFKVPMAMYILDEAVHKRVDLNERLSYSEDDYEEGTGVLQDMVSEGDSYTVQQLMELAITQSDNIATNMLLRRFGRENVWAFMTRLGGHVVSQDNVNVSTPADMGLYLRELFNPQVTAPSSRDMILKWMENTAFHDRLEAGLPADVKVAHKIGTLDNVCNDVGVVFTPNHTYIISVMSQGVNQDDAADVIAGLSALTYKDTDQR